MTTTETKKNGKNSKGMEVAGTCQLRRGFNECANRLDWQDKQRQSGPWPIVYRILALDTGTTNTGFVYVEFIIGELPRLLNFGIIKNQDMLKEIGESKHDAIVMENFQCMGMAVGISTFNAAIWLGRFIEASRRSHPHQTVHLMHRSAIKMEICGSPRAKDPNIRQAIIDMYPVGQGGGKVPQIGINKQRGPLYGVSSHVWSALAVAISFDKIMS
jgi:hypothetical protein|tara:strand:- start:100 stop:744 length:645 start_codon:yes stop_codon:yes gene_type:complete